MQNDSPDDGGGGRQKITNRIRYAARTVERWECRA